MATGKVIARHEKRRRRKEFLAFMEEVVSAYPERRLEVILDNLNTHKKNEDWLKNHPLVTFHYTPTRASWLNQVECWFCTFAEFAESGLPARVHEALIQKTHKDRLVGHTSRDAAAIEAREKPVKVAEPPAQKPRKRGRLKKGEAAAPKEPRRLERSTGMTLAQMLAGLPTACTAGTKRDAKGHTTSWIGYKLHIDTSDGIIAARYRTARYLGALSPSPAC